GLEVRPVTCPDPDRQRLTERALLIRHLARHREELTLIDRHPLNERPGARRGCEEDERRTEVIATRHALRAVSAGLARFDRHPVAPPHAGDVRSDRDGLTRALLSHGDG